MGINRDPKSITEIPDGLREFAKANDLFIVQVIIENLEEYEFGSFYAAFPCVPQINDDLIIDGGRKVAVDNVQYFLERVDGIFAFAAVVRATFHE